MNKFTLRLANRKNIVVEKVDGTNLLIFCGKNDYSTHLSIPDIERLLNLKSNDGYIHIQDHDNEDTFYSLVMVHDLMNDRTLLTLYVLGGSKRRLVYSVEMPERDFKKLLKNVKEVFQINESVHN